MQQSTQAVGEISGVENGLQESKPNDPIVKLPLIKFILAWISLVIGSIMAILSSNIIAVALPTISDNYSIFPATSLWLANCYEFAFVLTYLPFIIFGYIYGYRRIFIGGLGLFIVASLLSVFTSSFWILVVSRFLQAIATASIVTTVVPLTLRFMPQQKKLKIQAIIGFTAYMTLVLSPLVAGVLTQFLNWRWLFLINVPLGLFAALLAKFSLPLDVVRQKTENEVEIEKLGDVALFLITLPFGLSLLREFIQSVLVRIFPFLRCLSSKKVPIIRDNAMQNPIFCWSLGILIIIYVAQMMIVLALPFWLQKIFGYKPLDIGYFMLSWWAFNSAFAYISKKWLIKYLPAYCIYLGSLIIALGLIFIALIPVNPSFFDICWPLALSAIGFSLFVAFDNDFIAKSLPEVETSYSCLSLRNVASGLGQTIGALSLTLLFMIVGTENISIIIFVAIGFCVLATIMSLRYYKLRVTISNNND